MNSIEKAKEELQKQIEALYMTITATGQIIRIYSEEVHAEKEQAAQDAYHARLREIMADSQAQKARAQQTLSKADRLSYSWLTTLEISRAAQLSDMVGQDIQAMSLAEISDFTADAASSEDRAYRFAVLRQARAAWDDAIKAENTDASNPLVAREAQRWQDALRATLAPPEQLEAEQDARQILATADGIYRAAEYALPEGRERMANALKIDETHLPVDLPEIA